MIISKDVTSDPNRFHLIEKRHISKDMCLTHINIKVILTRVHVILLKKQMMRCGHFIQIHSLRLLWTSTMNFAKDFFLRNNSLFKKLMSKTQLLMEFWTHLLKREAMKIYPFWIEIRKIHLEWQRPIQNPWDINVIQLSFMGLSGFLLRLLLNLLFWVTWQILSK